MVKKFELKPWLSWKKQLDHEITELILKAYKGEIDGEKLRSELVVTLERHALDLRLKWPIRSRP